MQRELMFDSGSISYDISEICDRDRVSNSPVFMLLLVPRPLSTSLQMLRISNDASGCKGVWFVEVGGPEDSCKDEEEEADEEGGGGVAQVRDTGTELVL